MRDLRRRLRRHHFAVLTATFLPTLCDCYCATLVFDAIVAASDAVVCSSTVTSDPQPLEKPTTVRRVEHVMSFKSFES